QQRLSLAVAPFVDVGRLGEPPDLFGEAGVGQEPGDLVVEVDRARLRVRRGPAFQNGDTPAAAGEQQGAGEPGRAGADDEHISFRAAIWPSRGGGWFGVDLTGAGGLGVGGHYRAWCAPVISAPRSSGAMNDGGGG